MIINDKHCFAFIHIPKCAGTSVRSPLEQFDSYEGTFTNRVDEHQALGQLDYRLFAFKEPLKISAYY